MNSHTIFVNNYVGLIDNLEPKYKLEIIEKISKSIRSNRRRTIKKSTFGAFVSSKSAEDLIDDIRSTRKFNRNIESF